MSFNEIEIEKGVIKIPDKFKNYDDLTRERYTYQNNENIIILRDYDFNMALVLKNDVKYNALPLDKVYFRITKDYGDFSKEVTIDELNQKLMQL